MREVMKNRLKWACIILWVYYILQVIMKVSEFEKHLYFFVLFGSVIVVATLLFFLSKLSMIVLDLSPMIIVITRAFVTFALFQVIRNKSAGFYEVDQKQLHDNMNFVAYPALLLLSVNLKVDICGTFPITLISSFFVYKSAFAVEGENMSCYLQAELIAGTLYSRVLI